ncbi:MULTISPECIES: flavin reductase family protein [unclassified Micromonospora]|uniref:flavin reductase family protein n=1 Tax=unclassified Micromonospora TaxID=2617518 RepID=UPI0032470840
MTTFDTEEVTDSTHMRRVYGTFATGVTVVSVGGDEPHAMTANSFSAVSLDPPLVLVCIDRDALMHQALSRAGTFGISVLAPDQEAVARYYADRRRPLGPEQFEFADWRPGGRTDAPLLAGAVAHFECELWRSYDGGDHTIFLGRPRGMRRYGDGEALVFLGGRFRRLEMAPSAVVTS